jgi:hypothetical protein
MHIGSSSKRYDVGRVTDARHDVVVTPATIVAMISGASLWCSGSNRPAEESVNPFAQRCSQMVETHRY